MVDAQGQERWSVARRISAKQLFVDAQGRAAVLGADDVVTLHAADGAALATLPLLEHVEPALVSWGTAGRVWDDTLAGVLEDGWLALEGRGATLVFAPDGSPSATFDPEPLLRRHARAALGAARDALRARDEGWQEPWALVAIGWARVVGRYRLEDAVDRLDDLSERPLRVHTMTYAGSGPRSVGDDPTLLDRWALDPVRQAVHLARLRCGRESALATLQLGRRGPGTSTEWFEAEPCGTPTEVPLGARPSEVVAALGAPTTVGTDPITWRYAWLRASAPVMTDLRWSEGGVVDVTTLPLPAPHPRGLFA